MKQFRNLLKMDLRQIADGGLGDVVVDKASRGYVGFEASDDGLEFDITLSEGANREVFESVYDHSALTLSRGAVLRSTSPGNGRVRFTRRAVVQVVISAETMNDVVFALGGGLPAAPTILAHPQPVTVQPGVPAEFVVSAIGQAIHYQWRRDGEVMPGEEASNFVLASPGLGDDGAEFDCVLSNVGGSRTTQPALLTVQALATAPGAVTNLQAGTATQTTQPLSFGPPSTGTGPFTYQVAYRLGSSSGAFTDFGSPTSATSPTVTGLTAGTVYDYQVTASNAAGPGAAAVLNDISTAAPTATAPGAPTIGVATAGAGSASVAGTAPSSNGGAAIDKYRAIPYIGSTAGTPVESATLPVTLSGLSNGQAYTFKLQAHNSVGWGDESAASNSVTPSADVGYDIILAAGQSNMNGRSQPIDAGIDVIDPMVFQFGALASDSASYRKITPASDPMKMPDTANANRVGPSASFGRAYAARTGRKVLLVPVAIGGTAIVGGRWSSSTPGDLYTLAITQANLAIAAAQAQNADSRFVGAIWFQGETDGDNNVTQANYAAALNAVIAGLRAGISDASNAWFVMAQMVPEAIATHAGYPAIDLAHKQIAAGTPHTAIALTNDLTGYSSDSLHFTNSVGIRQVGARLDARVPTAIAFPGVVPSNTALPVVTGPAQEGQTLSATTGVWTGSPTTYTRQWRRNGTNISGATAGTYMLQAADIGTTITHAVTAGNAAGASPVPAVSVATAEVIAADGGSSAIVYDFEADTVGAAPANAAPSAGYSFVVATGGSSGLPGKYARMADSPAVGTAAAGLSFGQFDSRETQVVEWQHGQGATGTTIRAGMVLRAGALPSGGSYPLMATGYLFMFRGTEMRIYKHVADGTLTQLAASTTFAATLNRKLRATVAGSALTFEHSTDNGGTWNVGCTATDSSISAAGGVQFASGFGGSQGGAYFDNVSYSDSTGPPGGWEGMPEDDLMSPVLGVVEDWSTGSAVEAGRWDINVRQPDLIYQHPRMASAYGNVGVFHAPNAVQLGEILLGVRRFRMGAHGAEDGLPFNQVMVNGKPASSQAWNSYPARTDYDIKRCTTYPPPFKIRFFGPTGIEVGVIEAADGKPVNDPSFVQDEYYDPATKTAAVPDGSGPGWPDGVSVVRRHWNIGMALPWQSSRPNLSTQALSFYAGVDISPMSGKDNDTVIGFNPYLSTGTGLHGYNDIWTMAAMPSAKVSRTRMTPLDPWRANPNVGSYPYFSNATGYLYEPGSWTGHEDNTGQGGPRHVRSVVPTQKAMYVSDPTGSRLEGSVPWSLIDDEFNKAYANVSIHFCTDVITGAGIPKAESLAGWWIFGDGSYYGNITNPEGGSARTISLRAVGNGGNKNSGSNGQTALQWRYDATGRAVWGLCNYESDHHGEIAPGQVSMLRFSPMHTLLDRFAFDAGWMGRLGRSKPGAVPANSWMTRQMAWRLNTCLHTWVNGVNHDYGYTQEQIEARLQSDLEAYHALIYVPTMETNSQAVGIVGVRNLGGYAQPMANGRQLELFGGDNGFYMSHELVLMKTSGMWDAMRARSVKCAQVLDLLVRCMDLRTVDWMLDLGGRQQTAVEILTLDMGSGYTFTAADVPASFAALNALWPVDGVADLIYDAAGVLIRDSDNRESVHMKYQWVKARKIWFTEYPNARLDAAVAKWDGYYNEVQTISAAQSTPSAQRSANWKFRRPGGATLRPTVGFGG